MPKIALDMDFAVHRDAGNPHVLASVKMAKLHGPDLIADELPGIGPDGPMQMAMLAERMDARLTAAHRRRMRGVYAGRVYDPRLKCFVAVERASQPPPRPERRPRPAAVPQDLPDSPHRFEAWDRTTGARLWAVRGNARHALREFKRLAEAQGGSLADIVMRETSK